MEPEEFRRETASTVLQVCWSGPKNDSNQSGLLPATACQASRQMQANRTGERWKGAEGERKRVKR
jgi:hypothetical protein